MLLPIRPLDFELASPADLPVGETYRAARVLVRWHGVPLAILQVPVVSGMVRAREVGLRVMARLQPRLGREMARRALVGSGITRPPRVADHAPDPDFTGPPAISVAVCTRDRPDDMARCLASIAALRVPPLEVIVVDNAPATEATAELVKEHFPQFRYVREETPGLDHARNRAIAEARGEIIAYTDDDVMVDPGWIEALGRVFAEDPAIGLVAGLIEPAELETEAQALFERYGGFGRGCVRGYLQSPGPGVPMTWDLVGAGQLGAGANMAIRMSLFEKIGRFDPALDVGTPTLGGGDHEMFFRCLRSGMICLYEPTAVVRHRHRRTIGELSKLLYSYGFATRCFFEREALEFPADRPAIRKLARWWWRHWAWDRWKRSMWTPRWFPLELVNREIKGYRDGKGGYLRARRKIVADESKRPDAFLIPPADPRSGPAKTCLVVVDLEKPLRPLTEGLERDALEVIVQWRGKPLGRIHIKSRRTTIVPSRLADEIARALWWEVMTLGEEDPSISWSRHVSDLQELVNPRRDEVLALRPEAGVSVIVATCDRPDDLRRCLGSIFAMRTTRRLQVIVVDNRPGRPGIQEVLREFPRVELVEESKPGSSYARNAGWAAAREEFVAMTDDDMLVSEDWLERLLAPMVRADVVAVTGHTLPASLESDAELQFEAYGGFGRGYHSREFDEYWFHYWKRRATPTWQLGGTGNVAFRRSLFDDPQVGAFEECLGSGVPAGVGEDTLWFYQVLRAGHVILYEPSAVAWHRHRLTMDGLRRQLSAYSKGHVAYHLMTFLKYRDKRAMVRLGYELPHSMMSRYWARLRGTYDYPWKLLAIETRGMLLGPWALWQSKRHVRKHGPGARPLAPAEETR